MDVSELLRALSKWRRDGSTTVGSNDTEKKMKSVGMENLLLFHHSRTPTIQTWLEGHFSWLALAPTIEPQGDTSNKLNDCQIMAHPDWVRACVFSPDGRLMVSGSDDRCIRIWDVDTGRLQRVMDDFDGFVYSVVISWSGPNDHALVAASDTKTIRIYDLYTGRTVKVINEVESSTAEENPEGNEIDSGGKADHGMGRLSSKGITANDEDESRACDDDASSSEASDDSQVSKSLRIQSICIAQKGDRVAAATGETITVWDTAHFKPTVWKDLEVPPALLNKVTFSCDGSLLASSRHTEISIWDATAGKVLRRFPPRGAVPREGENHGSVFPPGGDASVENVSEPHGSNEEKPDEASDTSSTDAGQRSSQHTTASDATRSGHSDNISGLAFSHDGEVLASGSEDGIACVWDVKTGRTLAVLSHHSYVQSVSFSADGAYLAMASSDNTIRIWKRPECGTWDVAETVIQPHRVLETDGTVFSVRFAPQLNILASADSRGEVRIWNLDAGPVDGSGGEYTQMGSDKQSLSPQAGLGHTRPVNCVSISPEAELIASASTDGTICFWDGVTGARQQTMEAIHSTTVRSLTFSPDGKRMVSTSSENVAIVWSVKDRPARVMHTLKGHEDWIRSAVFSIDGNRVATASDDRTVMVWDITDIGPDSEEDRSPKSVPSRVFRGHDDWVYSVVFSPDGNRLASAGDDQRILIWNVAGQGDKDDSDLSLERTRALGPVRGLVFFPDGRKIMAVDEEGGTAVWKLETPNEKPIALMTINSRPFSKMVLKESHPDQLLTEFGAWPFDLSNTELEKAKGGMLELSRRDESPSWAPIGLSEDDKWITRRGRKVIFLPEEFRPARSSSCYVQGLSIVIGCWSGNVLLFKFAAESGPEYIA